MVRQPHECTYHHPLSTQQMVKWQILYSVYFTKMKTKAWYIQCAHTHTDGVLMCSLTQANLPNIHKWNRLTRETNTTRFHVHELSVLGNSQRHQVDGRLLRAGSKADRGAIASWDRVSVWGDGKVLEVGSADGCTTLWLTPLNGTI